MGCIVHFSTETSLAELADRNPDYTRIYMSTSRTGNTTSITLSKHAGDTLYILSDTDHERCSAYFQEESSEHSSAKKENSQTNPAKRAKQSTLLGFFRK